METPLFIMMIGLPCSGKSTHAQHLAEIHNANIHSSDAIRLELTGDINNQDHNNEVFQTLHRRVKDDLRSGKNCIYDACQVHYKERMAFLRELKNIPCEKHCVLMATPYDECLERSSKRERKVPEYVIKRMYKAFDVPYLYEGWDDITVLYSTSSYRVPYSFYTHTKHYNQHNSHHQLTLGEHCLAVCAQLGGLETSLGIAGLLHDCGKPFCQTFMNSKGEVTEQAHYYNHERVGSYDSLFYKSKDPLHVAAIIRWHMQPYFWERDNNEKLHNKYKVLWGNDLYNDIMALHLSDIAAH